MQLERELYSIPDDMLIHELSQGISIISHSYEDTREIARFFASVLHDGDVIAMDGDLGAGKTAFAGGLASGLGINEIIPSPTFTILHEYAPLFHFDVYRLSGSDDFYGMGFDEYIGRENSICIIEWADRIRDVLPHQTVQIIIFRIGSSDDREIVICFPHTDSRCNDFAVILEQTGIEYFCRQLNKSKNIIN